MQCVLCITDGQITRLYACLCYYSSKRFTPLAAMACSTVTDYMCHELPRIHYVCHNPNPDLSSFISYHRVCNKSKTASVTGGAGIVDRSGHHSSHRFFVGVMFLSFYFLCRIACLLSFVRGIVCPLFYCF